MLRPSKIWQSKKLKCISLLFFKLIKSAKEFLLHRWRNHGGNGGTCPRSFTATGALPPFKTDVIILCTELYHLGEGAHFASCYIYEYGPHYIAPIFLCLCTPQQPQQKVHGWDVCRTTLNWRKSRSCLYGEVTQSLHNQQGMRKSKIIISL